MTSDDDDVSDDHMENGVLILVSGFRVVVVFTVAVVLTCE